MRILFINEYTATRGGIDNVIDTEINGLIERKADVSLYSINHQREQRNFGIGLFKYFRKSSELRKLYEFIKKFKPDIVHVHNTYPLWGFLLPYLINSNVKVIQHLHNYYPFCLNSFFYINNNICTDCVDKNSWFPGIKKKCYDNSYSKSLFASIQKPVYKNWVSNSKFVDLFIGVSNFIIEKYVKFGLDYKQIAKLNNPISLVNVDNKKLTGSYILYLGNVINAKGVEIVCKLAQAMPDKKFKIAGEGRDLDSLKKKYNYLSNIDFTGYADEFVKQELIKNCRFLIMPTLWWESFGLVIIEAFSYGKPVLTSGNGATAELVENNKTGFIVGENSLSSYRIYAELLWNQLEIQNEFSQNCIRKSRQYSKEKHIDELIKIYGRILK